MHCGISKSQWWARRDYWWPGFDEAVANHVKKCEKCIPFLPSQAQQPIIHRNDAAGPMQAIGIHLYQSGGRDYLVVVDQFSGWPFAEHLRSTASSAIVSVLRRLFNTFGNPEKIYMDNGTNLVSREINGFLKKRGIPVPEPGAPYYPQANGLAESAVKQVKYLLQKYDSNWDAFEDNLLEWRDTPNDSGSTPNELFIGRRVRTSLSILPGKTNFDIENAVTSGARRKERRDKAYAKRRTHDLSQLNPGQAVSIQNPKGRRRWDKTGWIVHRKHEGRTYLVRFEGGAQRCGGQGGWSRRRILVALVGGDAVAVRVRDGAARGGPARAREAARHARVATAVAVVSVNTKARVRNESTLPTRSKSPTWGRAGNPQGIWNRERSRPYSKTRKTSAPNH